MKGEFEVADNLVNDFMIIDKGDDVHLPTALWTQQGVNFIYFFYHLRPSSRRFK